VACIRFVKFGPLCTGRWEWKGLNLSGMRDRLKRPAAGSEQRCQFSRACAAWMAGSGGLSHPNAHVAPSVSLRRCSGESYKEPGTPSISAVFLQSPCTHPRPAGAVVDAAAGAAASAAVARQQVGGGVLAAATAASFL
jgi:hypothetical protein